MAVKVAPVGADFKLNMTFNNESLCLDRINRAFRSKPEFEGKQSHFPEYFGSCHIIGRTALKLEYVEHSLEDYLALARPEERRARQIAIYTQMLEALEHLHKCLYVHRDVKLENFRVTKEGIVKLIDFGISFDYWRDGVHRDRG